MKPPIFLWKSGLLDVFDTTAELEERYPPKSLIGGTFVLYDSLGRTLSVYVESDGSTRIDCDDREPANPAGLAALLRECLQRGGMSAEAAGSLTLTELIEEVYPSIEPSVRSVRGKRADQSISPGAQQSESKQRSDRLARAFGMAAIAGVFAACIGLWLAMTYYRNVPPAPGFGEIGKIREWLVGSCEAAVGGALVAGVTVFLCALIGFSRSQSNTGRSIGCAFMALVAVLLFVGAAVWAAFVLINLFAA
jgi:hypothetical protein